MRNLLIEISYNGANYHGYQVQANAITITEVIQDTIEKILKKRENIVGCSRTDSKVHANSYYFNMKTESNIPCEKFITVINNALPDDIVILSCREVDMDFHARYNCIGKEYIYKIYNNPVRNPYLIDLALHHKKYIDVDALNKAAQVFVGTHDFTSFCSMGFKQGTSMIKTIEFIEVYRENDFINIKVKADAFLYNMVRIIVGTLLYVNDGKIKPEDLIHIIEAKDRTKAGKTAPPQGLYLNQVFFDT
ncbi:tRNA pseudouridine(38-40) synthase TruA [Paludicola sp. MB14-C6]|uniref:tRNA pseudouridine(38-40) synthase TruA n=1 Tax=Paludihabitans sp. MB14-C6 TaxID=3070656 RepID=UPI0027DAB806|nr:tRNA pseudouridine(38-40) synthase TruA [Paludicola sp. MB14-C6]WMJ23298.1 tRNA pseudouridine(38-40) synthase TruA [Paludicola sp. MB14-C6]